MKAKVTIGVCVKNSAYTIRETIESIIDQDFPHELIEVIFVDDGSEDETLSIIERYTSKMHMQIRIFHHKWKGLGLSRNIVVDNSNGDHIIWVDGDMILPADHVRKQVEFMEENSKVGIAKARHAVYSREPLVAALEDISYLVLDDESKGKASPGLLGTGGSIYRTEAIKQVGGFDQNLTGVGEDQDAAHRVFAAGWLFGRTETTFYERRRRTWRALWDEYSWWGNGMHQTHKKNRDIIILWKMLPLFGFIAGFFSSLKAYRMTHRKSVFLLPYQFTFKSVAWWIGYLKSYLA